jgi:hypothetical protein
MLPDFLIENFEIVFTTNFKENLNLYFEEKTKPPTAFDSKASISNDFIDEITIQDSPLRGKFAYLHVKSRR